MKKNIILFDMDGTITEPRGPFKTEFLLLFRKILKSSEIGILSGADISDIEKQLLRLIRYSEIRYHLHLLPCNGTKYYKPPVSSDDNFNLVHENNMESELGKRCLTELFRIVTKMQSDVCYSPIPLSGHFINYRGSMINWCPIGRNANKEDRQFFINYDNQNSYRENKLKTLQHQVSLKCPNKVDVKLGGQTSFDIYPTGWDKTYALRHFENMNCWFVGDACHKGGNDHEIYELLKKENRAFHTKSPEHTIQIIEREILPNLSTHSSTG